MKHMTFRERRYRRAHLDCVRHITLDPKGPGVVRIHMIPPRDETPAAPFLLLLNGAQLVPLNLSWAIMLANLMDQLQAYEGQDLAEDQWEALLTAAVEETHRTYPRTKRQTLASDLHLMLTSLVAIAQGREPEAEVGLLLLSDYAPEMTAPHRMDLMEYIRRGVVDEKIKADIDHKHAVSRFKFQTLPVYQNGLPIVLEEPTDYYNPDKK